MVIPSDLGEGVFGIGGRRGGSGISANTFEVVVAGDENTFVVIVGVAVGGGCKSCTGPSFERVVVASGRRGIGRCCSDRAAIECALRGSWFLPVGWNLHVPFY